VDYVCDSIMSENAVMLETKEFLMDTCIMTPQLLKFPDYNRVD